MQWSNNRTHIRWPLYKRFLLIAGLILLIISAVVLGVTIPVTLTTHANHIAQSTYDQVSPFNVTYLLTDQSSRSIVDGLDLDSINKKTVAQHFESALNLSLKNILHIRNIYSNTAIRSRSKSRRKRSVQCDGDSTGVSGPVLIFDFNITHPSNLPCQSQTCINETYADAVERFKSHKNLSINFGNVSKALNLCSFGASLYSVIQSTTSNTQKFTTVSSTSSGFNISTSSTPSTIDISSTDIPDISSTMNISVTNIPGVNGSSSTIDIPSTDISDVNVSSTMHISSTDIPGVNGSSSTIDISSTDKPDVGVSLTMDMPSINITTADILTTDIPDVSVSSTMNSSSIKTTVTTVLSVTDATRPLDSSNSTSNGTNDVCLQKLAITQEQVPPYRITYTSTLFFQNDHLLIVVGASKFETFIEMQTIKRDIIIDGVMVYNNCQRTLDVSLPMVCHDSASS